MTKIFYFLDRETAKIWHLKYGPKKSDRNGIFTLLTTIALQDSLIN